MLKSLLRDRLLLILLLLAVLLRLFSLNPEIVERYYTNGFYPAISGALRLLFGWIPFSAGDLLYAAGFLFFAWKAWKFIRLLARRQLKEYLSHVLFRKYLRLCLWIYLVFQVFWGLNYDRQGIARQLQLEVQPYHEAELRALVGVLRERICTLGDQVDSMHRLSFKDFHNLKRGAVAAYAGAAKPYPFLAYRFPSVKPSLLTPLGNYVGFTGYYNPFTAESQVKTDIPLFLLPFVQCHEIGHQLGYAKENEANFAGFLSARASGDPGFRYSAYYEMMLYSLRELRRFNPVAAYNLSQSMHPRFRIDRKAYIDYLLKNANALEPVMSNVYGQYLKMNNQPSGLYSYNEVVQWLVAYGKKYGWESI